MIVVDASLAIKRFLLQPDRDAARRLLEPGCRLIAPELVVAEVADAMWRRVMAGQGDARQASATAASLPRFSGLLMSLMPLASRALQIAAEPRHPVHDCFYLALAEDEGAMLVTADRRLVGRLRILDVPAPYVTNLAFGATEEEVFITAATDAWEAPYPGKVFRVANR